MNPARHTVVCRREAMNTLFEIILAGQDPENLAAAGEAALDEVARVEKILSRFDPASETSRINRDAHAGPVLLDHEMTRILLRCHEFSLRTDGHFDVTAVSRATDDSPAPAITIDPDRRLLQFQRPGVFLDFGGCGKGYALDRAAALLYENGIDRALLHGGTSSIRAIGAWPVSLRDPWEQSHAIGRVRLRDAGLSCSATSHGQEVSDIIDPAHGRPLTAQAGCVVIAKEGSPAFIAEMLSTGLLAMGRDRARICCQRPADEPADVAWIDRREGRTTLEWLTKAHE